MSAKRASDRAFGLVFTGLFTVIAVIVWRFTGQIPIWAVGVAGVLLIVALIGPGLLMPLNRLWTRFGAGMAIVVNHVVLGAFYYVVILSVGMFSRLLAGTMTKKPDPGLETYWMPVKRQATAENYRDLF